MLDVFEIFFYFFTAGMTLVNLACRSPLEGGIVEQIEYLVKKQKADVTISDTAGNTPVSPPSLDMVKCGSVILHVFGILPNRNTEITIFLVLFAASQP